MDTDRTTRSYQRQKRASPTAPPPMFRRGNLRTKISSEQSKALSILRDHIENGGFKSGMKMLTERALAAKLGVGRPAIREAIKALGILGVLESRRGDGTYVRSLDALEQGWPGKVEFLSSNFNMLDLLEVRKMIEPQAARLAASRAAEVQLRQIGELGSIETRSWPQLAQIDLLLHAAIIEAAGNPILLGWAKALGPSLRKSRELTATTSAEISRTLKEHRAIAEAIVKGEADKAERAMLEHLNNVGLDLISNHKRQLHIVGVDSYSRKYKKSVRSKQMQSK